MKLSTKLGRDNSQGCFWQNSLAKKKRQDPNIFHGIDQQEKKGETQILSKKSIGKIRSGTHIFSTKSTNKREVVGPKSPQQN
jgi:hypothetical protein